MTTITIDGKTFRDLDHDGVLAPYEDWRLPAVERATDLVARLNLKEKMGLMLHGTLPSLGGPLASVGIGDTYDLDAIEDLVTNRGIVTLISRIASSPGNLARQNNAIQQIAARSRLGIPVTVSTDPRHHTATVAGASVEGRGFTCWPGPLGLAATRDADLVRQFGDTVRREYRATGFHMALSPQADLATSPRWSRTDGTFGEDPALVRKLVGAYVEGVQGGKDGVRSDGLAAVVKHWVGYGAAPDGWDGHNHYGRFSEFPGGALDRHIEAFLDAFENRVASVMPTYNILKDALILGQKLTVGAGYSPELLTGLLRGEHGFAGVILSDWAISKDVTEPCRTGEPAQGPADISMAWGVESLSRPERFALGINAGLDQFGGEDDPSPLAAALDAGLLTEARLDESAFRILMQKFELGLFENPFVDEDFAEEEVGRRQPAADAAASRSFVFVKKPAAAVLSAGSSVHVTGMNATGFESRGITVVNDAADADVAVIRTQTPWELLHPGFFFGARQHEGDLDFKPGHAVLDQLEALRGRVPVILVVDMDRPAILSTVEPMAQVVIAAFGGTDEALVERLLKPGAPTQGLPFSLPRDMAAVEAQLPDKPHDDPDPLYPFGHGL